MAVEIKLDLDASGATGKIGQVALALKGLERTADDIDIDFDADIGNITDEINKFSEALEGIDVDMDDIGSQLESAAKELNEAEVTVSTDGPDGSTGDGDSTGDDPPFRVSDYTADFPNFSEAATADGSGDEDGFSFHRFKSKLADATGFDTSQIRSLGLSDEADYSDLDWNELQSKAKDEGVYGTNPSRKDLESRLAEKHRFGGREIVIDTDKLGTVSFDRAMQAKRSEGDVDATSPDVGIMDDDRDRKSIFRRSAESAQGVDNLKDSFGSLGSRLRRLKPTMGKYMQLLAAMIPIAVALGTQLLGVAAAMGAVGAAGAGIMGLGLLGHADSLEGSVAEAKSQIQSLKQDTFDVFQPVMQQFAPMQARMFDSMPGGMQGISEAMEGLTAYEDTFYEIGSALAGGMEEAIDIIVRNEDAISQLATRFGGIIGSDLLDFFEWLIKTAYENQELIISLGEAFMDFASIAYNISMIIARIVAAFRPLFSLIASVAELLNSPLIVGILTAVTSFGLLIGTVWKVTTALYAALGALSAFGSGGIIGGIVGGISYLVGQLWGLITTMWSAIFTSQALIATLSALTLGAFAVGSIAAGTMAMDAMQTNGPSSGAGGGMGGGSVGGGGASVYNDNRSYNLEAGGDMDYATQKGVLREIEKGSEESSARNYPDIELESNESNSNRPE